MSTVGQEFTSGVEDHPQLTRELWEIQGIREALGVGHKPMLSDLPRIVAERMEVLRIVRGEIEACEALLGEYRDHINLVVAVDQVRRRLSDLEARIQGVMK